MGRSPIRIAVVGDVHLAWDARDVAALDAAGYDAILFVGDLAGRLPRRAAQVARSIATLRTRALLIAGNHDAGVPFQGEVRALGLPRLARWMGRRMDRAVDDLASALRPATLGGYSVHRCEAAGGPFQVLVARPHSEGGPTVAFPEHLARAHGVRTMEASAARLRALVESTAPAVPLVVLAHNGPTGLGRGPGAIWGARPRRHQGDGGDPDLAACLEHARRLGRRIEAVVAGHLHHQPRRGGPARPATVRVGGVLYVNAAEVPRRRTRDGQLEAYHVALTLGGGGAEARERWLPLPPPRAGLSG